MRSIQINAFAGIVVGAVSLIATSAEAHVSVASGPAQANKSQKITFGVGHGCEVGGNHYDTARVTVDIPAGLTSVRPLRGDFGPVTLTRSGTNVTSVTWTKPAAEIAPGDDNYYEVVIRARVADVPFTKIYFNVHQVCVDNQGNEVTADWTALPGEEGNPAAALTVVPARVTGWNKYTLGASTTVASGDFGSYFGDALIVWRGAEAFSSNANTAAQIAATSGVTALASDILPTQEIWVRY